MPRSEDIDLTGPAITREQFDSIQSVNLSEVTAESLSQKELFLKLSAFAPTPARIMDRGIPMKATLQQMRKGRVKARGQCPQP